MAAPTSQGTNVSCRTSSLHDMEFTAWAQEVWRDGLSLIPREPRPRRFAQRGTVPGGREPGVGRWAKTDAAIATANMATITPRLSNGGIL